MADYYSKAWHTGPIYPRPYQLTISETIPTRAYASADVIHLVRLARDVKVVDAWIATRTSIAATAPIDLRLNDNAASPTVYDIIDGGSLAVANVILRADDADGLNRVTTTVSPIWEVQVLVGTLVTPTAGGVLIYGLTLSSYHFGSDSPLAPTGSG